MCIDFQAWLLWLSSSVDAQRVCIPSSLNSLLKHCLRSDGGDASMQSSRDISRLPQPHEISTSAELNLPSSHQVKGFCSGNSPSRGLVPVLLRVERTVKNTIIWK